MKQIEESELDLYKDRISIFDKSCINFWLTLSKKGICVKYFLTNFKTKDVILIKTYSNRVGKWVLSAKIDLKKVYTSEVI